MKKLFIILIIFCSTLQGKVVERAFAQTMRVIFVVMYGGGVSMPYMMTDWMDLNGYEYKIVEKMPKGLEGREIGAWKFDDEEKAVLYIKKNVQGSADFQENLIPHELIHMMRIDNGLWTGNIFIEEYVACMLMNELVETMDYTTANFDEIEIWIATRKVNNLLDRDPCKEEQAVIREEYQKTLNLFGNINTKEG